MVNKHRNHVRFKNNLLNYAFLLEAVVYNIANLFTERKVLAIIVPYRREPIQLRYIPGEMGDEKNSYESLLTNLQERQPNRNIAAGALATAPLIMGGGEEGQACGTNERGSPSVLPPSVLPATVSPMQRFYPAFAPQPLLEPFYYRPLFPNYIRRTSLPFLGFNLPPPLQMQSSYRAGVLPLCPQGSTLMTPGSAVGFRRPQEVPAQAALHVNYPVPSPTTAALPASGQSVAFNPFQEAVKAHNEHTTSRNGEAESFSVNAYRRRNVYKSIIRHMHKCITKDSADISSMLTKSGYAKADVEQAFFRVSAWNNSERQSGTSKKSQSTVEKILAKKTAITYILRETLWGMMKKWETGRTGKISDANLAIYRDVCSKFYNKTVELTGQSVQCPNLNFWH